MKAAQVGFDSTTQPELHHLRTVEKCVLLGRRRLIEGNLLNLPNQCTSRGTPGADPLPSPKSELGRSWQALARGGK